MQNINSKLLEALKQRNIDLNLTRLAENTPTQLKVSRQDSSSTDLSNSSSLEATSAKFRVRSINPNQEESAAKSSFGKTSTKMAIRPTTAMRNEIMSKTTPIQTPTLKGRPMTTQNGRPGNPQKFSFPKQEPLKTTNEDLENNINFVNMDDEDEVARRIREELEIFNDIADLNEEKLADIVNVEKEKLNKLTRAEMKVDLSFNSLQQAGQTLVNLKQLKLNNSIVNSLRDIGNSFKNLEILWISKCGLKDLAGLSAFPNLKELYASYNNINDLSAIIYHPKLQVLDLEGNEIDNLSTIENIRSLDSLTNLTLTANPICEIENYEQKVINILPNLEHLNDKTKEEVSSEKASKNKKFVINTEDTPYAEDIKDLYSKFEKFQVFSVKEFESSTRQALLDDMIKEPSEEDIITMSVKKSSKKAKANIQENNELGQFSINVSAKKSSQRPQTSKARVGGKANSIFSDMNKIKAFGDGASDIIHQTDQAFAGNPLKALRHKRRGQFTSGFENVKGENLAKPKDIMKLIEEFEVNDDPESDESRKLEELFSSNYATEPSQEIERGIKHITKSQTLDETTSPSIIGRANSLIQREVRPVIKSKVLSQEAKEGLSLVTSMNYKEISIQDIRSQLTTKSRFKIQIKTKKTPASILPNKFADQNEPAQV